MKLARVCGLLLLLLCLATALLVSADSTQAKNKPSPDATVPKKQPLAQPLPDPVPESSGEQFTFQTDVQRVMKIIINSLYKTKEIFLRELISNASDALDKLRFLSLTDTKLLEGNNDLKITVRAFPDSKTLVLTDTGVGMTKKELKENLGTIAKSGTAEFLKAVENDKNDVGLIGQFGVGFFSAYLVADRVTVASKSPAEDKQYVWTSDAENGFSIVEDPRGNSLGRGTEIVLHLKDDAVEYLKEDKLKGLIAKYSEFINFPIYLHTNQTIEEEVPVTEEDMREREKAHGDDDLDDELRVDDKDKADADADKPTTKKVSKTVQDWERVNVNKPIWTRPASEVTPDEYNQFYQSYFKDYKDPVSYTHFKGEGNVNFKAILYIPQKAPANPTQATQESYLHNIKLFVRRVFITDELIDFLPRYLSFIKGLIDSDDFPLNVSRETVQQNRILAILKKRVVGKALEMFKKLAENGTSYQQFYNNYGHALKLGAIEDKRNQAKILPLLRFRSSALEHRDNVTSFDGYISRMRKGQDSIFFVTGFDLDEISKSPHIEALVKRGYEVLYLSDPIDEYFTQAVTEYNGKKFANVAKGDLKFGDEDEETKQEQEELASKFQPLADWLGKTMSDKIDKAVVSNRLTDSPCALVASAYGWTGPMEQIMHAQKSAVDDYMFDFYAKQKKTLEINPRHPLIEALLAKVEDDATDEDVVDLALSLFDITSIRSGYQIKDTTAVARRLERAIRLGLGVDLKAKADVKLKEAPEVAATKRDAGSNGEDDAAKEKVPIDAEEDALHDEL
ncbi:hypothetical protein RI367_003779 [Sorochytrium milnesiophthora]